MHEPDPILKFEIKNGDNVGKFIDMKLTEFTWPKGGTGICPYCGAPVDGTGRDWLCTNEECGAAFYGPIF